MTNDFTLVLLFKKSSSVAPLIYSLKQKGIESFVTHQESEFFQLIATKKPNYVGLSVTHGSVGPLLPKVQVPYFIFAEDDSKETQQKLRQYPAPTKIAGVISAYTVGLCLGSLVKSRVDKDGKLIRTHMSEGEQVVGEVIIEDDSQGLMDGQIIIADDPEALKNIGGTLLSQGAEITSDPGAVHLEDKKENKGTGIVVSQAKRERIGGVFTGLGAKILKDITLPSFQEMQLRDLDPSDKSIDGPWKYQYLEVIFENLERGVFLFAYKENLDPWMDKLVVARQRISKQLGKPVIVQEEWKDINLQVNDLYRWSRRYCDFVFVPNINDEVFLGFFNSSDVAPNLEDANNESISFDVEELIGGQVLEFDVYIYFNRNDKMLPYFSKGSQIPKDKISRLKESGVKKLFIKKIDIPIFNKFYIHYYLQLSMKDL